MKKQNERDTALKKLTSGHRYADGYESEFAHEDHLVHTDPEDKYDTGNRELPYDDAERNAEPAARNQYQRNGFPPDYLPGDKHSRRDNSPSGWPYADEDHTDAAAYPPVMYDSTSPAQQKDHSGVSFCCSHFWKETEDGLVFVLLTFGLRCFDSWSQTLHNASAVITIGILITFFTVCKSTLLM